MDKLNITLFSIYDEKNSPISKIIEGLFLGCEAVSKNIELLEKNNIKKIVKIGTDLKIHFPKKFEYLSINIHDHPDENIIDYFEACYNFIDQSLINNQNVLVHCFKGISRSASVICAFLIKKFKWNFNESIRFIESKRPWISINDGFDKQLQEYDLKNNSKVFAKNNYRKRTNYYLPIIKPYILRKRSNYKLLSLGGKIIKKNVYLHKKVNLKQQYLDEKILYLKRLISQSHLEHCDKPKEIQKKLLLNLISNPNLLVKLDYKSKHKTSKSNERRRNKNLGRQLIYYGKMIINEIFISKFEEDIEKIK